MFNKKINKKKATEKTFFNIEIWWKYQCNKWVSIYFPLSPWQLKFKNLLPSSRTLAHSLSSVCLTHSFSMPGDIIFIYKLCTKSSRFWKCDYRYKGQLAEKEFPKWPNYRLKLIYIYVYKQTDKKKERTIRCSDEIYLLFLSI